MDLPPTSGSDPGSSRTPRTGRTFAGRFELLGELGRGGVGVVYRARDLQTGGEVALKLLRDPALAGGVVAERLRREGRAAAGLDHPGIVRLLASGEAGGLPWLAFELVPGCRTLTRAWRGLGLLPRVTLIREAALALGHAHAHGLVHRDVKPSNLLVDAEGRVRVADFGVALSEGWERITRSGVMLGTPTHMAPEQIETRRGAIGAWSDVWALGVILYQAMTDELPFSGETLLEISARVVDARPTPPRSIDPTVPPALERVCLACLRVRPEDRPPDGAALARLLDQALADGERPARTTRGVQRALAALTVAAAALLAGVILLRGRTRRPDAAPPRPLLAAPTPAPATLHDAAWLASASLAELQAASAASGEGPVWTRLGQVHRDGTFAPPDLGEAQRCFERAAALDDPQGALELARLLRAARDAPAARRWLERALEQGSLLARVELARMLAAGEGGERDRERAARLLAEAGDAEDPELLAARGEAAEVGWWGKPEPARAAALYRRAAEAGNVAGMLGWAGVLAVGKGVDQDTAAAATWYRRAGEAGSAFGMAHYALMLGDGEGVPEDQVAARRWLEAAAPAEAVAGYALGMYLCLGLGGPKDEARAREVYRQAAERGHVESMAKLGEMLLDGKGGAKDEVAAFLWLEKAARSGDPEGMRRYGLARWLRDGASAEERKDGADWIHRSALLGHGPAMTFWAVILLAGIDVPRDVDEAREWLERAAGQGEAVGMYELAWRLKKGKDFPADPAEARRWLEQAATHHHKEAQLELGLLLAGREGDPPDWAGAREWLGRAANGSYGLPEAMFELGELLADGRGGPPDPSGAEALWERAAAQGNGKAHQRLGSASFERRDYAAAMRHWQAAARSGEADAWIGVGLLHMRGQGCPRDARAAARAFQEASKLGNVDGGVLLALVVHEGGPGLPANPEQALDLMLEIARGTDHPSAYRWSGIWLLEAGGAHAAEGRGWLEKGARAGDAASMARLAEALREGLGGPQDPQAAERWEAEAARARAREEQGE